MPESPPRPCTQPGCPKVVRGRSSRCPAHVRERRRQHDERRGSSAQRGYGRQWRKVRVAHLSRKPLCRFHAERGEVVSANEVDHIDGNSSNNEESNLRSLCKPCHSARTMRDQVNGRRS